MSVNLNSVTTVLPTLGVNFKGSFRNHVLFATTRRAFLESILFASPRYERSVRLTMGQSHRVQGAKVKAILRTGAKGGTTKAAVERITKELQTAMPWAGFNVVGFEGT